MNKSLSINGVIKHYQELKHNGDIKLIFRKSSIFTHKSTDGKPFYTVRPIVVKIGNWIDDRISFSFTLKNKFKYVVDSKQIDLWCLTIAQESKSFKLEDGSQCEYHETSLQYINNSKLQEQIESMYLASSNVSEMKGDSF